MTDPMFTLAQCQAEYLAGVAAGKREMSRGLIPNTVEIQITVLGSEDNIETIKRVVSFEQVKQSNGKVLRLETERTVAEIATQGILKELIESTTL